MSQTVRINGLIRAFNQVRSRLQTGLRPEEAAPFKTWVHSLVRDVEQICAARGRTPNHLPAPSRRAYLFLKQLNTDNLPLRPDDQAAQTQPGLRLKNILNLAEHLADLLWTQLPSLSSTPGAPLQPRRFAEERVAAIEQICIRNRVTPASLEKPSRQVYCWLKFLLSEENLSLHLEALEKARRAVQARAQDPARPIQVQLMAIGALWRKKDYCNTVLLKVHEGFLNAPQEVWDAIACSALARANPASKELVRSFAESDDFSEVVFELESFAAPDLPPTQGYAHDLAASFQRVNAAYFGGAMPMPKLVWNRTLTGRKFGHYKASSDTVMLSISLDAPTVPNLVLDFVMYHELLHKKHGSARINGRRIVHSPEFRADERRFASYAEAEAHLERLARSG